MHEQHHLQAFSPLFKHCFASVLLCTIDSFLITQIDTKNCSQLQWTTHDHGVAVPTCIRPSNISIMQEVALKLLQDSFLWKRVLTFVGNLTYPMVTTSQ